MRNVLIVSFYFPPLNSIAAKRYGTMCKYFRENGYEPYILTTVKDNRFFGSKHDLAIPISEKNIIRIARKEPDSGIKAYGISKWMTLFDKLKLASRVMESGDLLWYENIKEMVDLKRLKSVDIVIGTYGPMGNLYAAKYIAKRLGCPYIAELRDFISDWKWLPDGYRQSYMLDSIVERRMLSLADGIVVVAPRVKKILQRRYPQKRIVTIFNGWDESRAETISGSQEKYLYYAGSLDEHILEGFIILLRALKKVNEKENVKFILRLVGFQKLNNRAKEIVREMEMENKVMILSPAAGDVIKEERGRAYINVVLNAIHEEEQEWMAMMCGKTYEYMNEKAPILAVTPPKSDLAQVISYTKKGIGTIAEDEIVDFILHTNSKYEGNDNVRKFSRKYQAKRLCRFMDYILKNSRKEH